MNYVGILTSWLAYQPQDVKTREELGEDHDDHGKGDHELPGPRTARESLGDITDTPGGGLGVLSHHHEQLDQEE